MRDVDGRVQKVRVDVSYVDGLLQYLDTTPAAVQTLTQATVPQLSDTWSIEMMRRACALVLTVLVMAVASIAWAVVAPSPASASPLRAPGGACSTEEWKQDFRGCVSRLADVTAARAECLNPPTPSTPDSGLAGWFAERPPSSTKPGPQGIYSQYGYAGYSYTTYDLDGGCASTLTDPDYKFETTVSNGEFMIATAVIGASNALRERAWDPQSLWGWADPLVEQATRAVYREGVQRLRRDHAGRRRAVPVVALPSGRHGRGHHHGRLGHLDHGDRDGRSPHGR